MLSRRVLRPCLVATRSGHQDRPVPALPMAGLSAGGRLHRTREDSVGGSWGGEGPEEESSSDSMLARSQSRCRQPRIASLDRLAEPVISLVSPARGALIGCLACSIQSAPDISWPCNHNRRGCACLPGATRIRAVRQSASSDNQPNLNPSVTHPCPHPSSTRKAPSRDRSSPGPFLKPAINHAQQKSHLARAAAAHIFRSKQRNGPGATAAPPAYMPWARVHITTSALS